MFCAMGSWQVGGTEKKPTGYAPLVQAPFSFYWSSFLNWRHEKPTCKKERQMKLNPRTALLLCFGLAWYCAPAQATPGTVVSWGGGQTGMPSGLNDIVAISSSLDHSLALHSDGTVTAWGYDFDNQSEVPAGLGGVTAIASGAFFSVALKSDGTVSAWGDNQYAQCNVPPNLAGVTAIAAGRSHGLALKSDGTVSAWGSDLYGQCDVPAGLTGVIAIAASWNYSVALRSGGTVVAWGGNDAGQTAVPSGLTGVIAISANEHYCLALKSDGTVVGWGLTPTIPPVISGVTGIAAGDDHWLALQPGMQPPVAAYGGNESGQCNVPSNLSNVQQVAAGWNYSLALTGSAGSTSPLVATNPRYSTSGFSVSVQTQSGHGYALQYKDSLTDASWTTTPQVSGTGGVITLNGPLGPNGQRFYRVAQE